MSGQALQGFSSAYLTWITDKLQTLDKDDKMLTQARLKEFFHYDLDTGLFTRVKSAGCSAKGSIVGTSHNDGYLSMEIDKKGYLLHRLAWLYVIGSFPEFEIDHIDGDRKNNKLANLRQANDLENAQNRKLPLNNTSGYVGVFFKDKKWYAKIDVNKKRYFLGYHKTAELAHEAYKEAKARLHTFSPNLR